MQAITFKSSGHDDYLDFLKGVCILFIILNHCLPEAWFGSTLFYFWGRFAVPIFLFIQVFHGYKRGLEGLYTHWGKIWRRVVKPFILVNILIVGSLLIRPILDNRLSASTVFWSIIPGGPGGYYPWIYVQFAVLLPLLAPLLQRWGEAKSAVVFIVASQCMEIACCLCHLPEWAYRLLFFRYTFIIYLGYLMVKHKGKVNDWQMLLLAGISIAAIFFFCYTGISLRPWFYDYRETHWICYFHIVTLVLLLSMAYRHCGKAIASFIGHLGVCSYEIFLCQLAYFSLFYDSLRQLLEPLGHPFAVSMAMIAVSVAVSIAPAFFMKRL